MVNNNNPARTSRIPKMMIGRGMKNEANNPPVKAPIASPPTNSAWLLPMTLPWRSPLTLVESNAQHAPTAIAWNTDDDPAVK